MISFRINFISNLLVQDFLTYESAADAAPSSDQRLKTPTEAVLKDYAEELLAAVPFPVERK